MYVLPASAMRIIWPMAQIARFRNIMDCQKMDSAICGRVMMDKMTAIDVPGLYCDDISFCLEQCDWKICPRNQKNIRDHTRLHSFLVDIPGDCPKTVENQKESTGRRGGKTKR